MPKKFLLISALLLAFSALLIFQVRLVYAHGGHHHDHLVTGPVTGPITFPSFTFNISGHVDYHVLGRWFKFWKRKFPATDVTIKATNVHTHDMTSADTDDNGDYWLDLEPGFYWLVPTSTRSAHFAPPARLIHVHDDRDNLDFQGLFFP